MGAGCGLKPQREAERAREPKGRSEGRAEGRVRGGRGPKAKRKAEGAREPKGTMEGSERQQDLPRRRAVCANDDPGRVDARHALHSVRCLKGTGLSVANVPYGAQGRV